MDKYGMTHLFDVVKRISLMAHQPLPRRGQQRHENDDYVISAVLMRELRMAINEVENLERREGK